MVREAEKTVVFWLVSGWLPVLFTTFRGNVAKADSIDQIRPQLIGVKAIVQPVRACVYTKSYLIGPVQVLQL